MTKSERSFRLGIYKKDLSDADSERRSRSSLSQMKEALECLNGELESGAADQSQL